MADNITNYEIISIGIIFILLVILIIIATTVAGTNIFSFYLLSIILFVIFIISIFAYIGYLGEFTTNLKGILQSIFTILRNDLFQIIWNCKWSILTFIALILYYNYRPAIINAKNYDFLSNLGFGININTFTYGIDVILNFIIIAIFFANIMYNSTGEYNKYASYNTIAVYFLFILYLFLTFSYKTALNSTFGLTIGIFMAVIGLFYLFNSLTTTTTNVSTNYSGLFWMLIIAIIIISIIVFSYGGLKTQSIFWYSMFIFCVLFIIALTSNIIPISQYANIQGVVNNIIKLCIGTSVFAYIGYLLLTSGTGDFWTTIKNLIIIALLLAILYKFISETDFYQSSEYLRLIIDAILYIPCLITNLINNGVKLYNNSKFPSSSSLSSLRMNTNMTYYILFVLICLIYVFYFMFYPAIDLKNGTQGGSIVVINPMSLNTEGIVSNYADLNNINVNNSNLTEIKVEYNYAFSFWINIIAVPSYSAEAYDSAVSILNYNFAPNILYNPKLNSLIFNIKDKSNPSTTDENGTINTIYSKKDVLLQKWNHIVFQYNGGIVDIFINGLLEKSVDNVIPDFSHTLCNLVVGQSGGIAGGLCNLVYFNHNLNIYQIKTIYNTFKYKNPPIPYYASDKVINNANKIIPYVNPLDNTWRYGNAPSSNVEEVEDGIRDPEPTLTKVDVNYLSRRWNPTQQSINDNGDKIETTIYP
jgi:hypothetical protein